MAVGDRDLTVVAASERRLRFLDELAQSTQALASPDEVMTTTARLLGQHLGANRCAYAQVDADEDHFDVVGDYNDGVPSIVGRFAIGGLADRLGRVASIALLEASLGASYLLWLGAGGYVALAIFSLWLGLSYGGIVSLMPAICMDLFGARAVSSILGALYSGAAFGNLLGPVLAGAVFDRSGSYVPVIWACVILASCSAIASAQLLRDRRPLY